MGLNKKVIDTDFCVIGGGMAGISAAITAARLGVKTVIIQERSVFGGNASGEIRMWICGAEDFRYKEAGLLEEINLENYFYNPNKKYPLWDALLYGKVCQEKNITPLLNCTCYDAIVENNKIKSVIAYQMTTQTEIIVNAKLFADCSGDSITALTCGAEFSYGRESVDKYGETMMQTHIENDNKTMGNSCIIQAVKKDKKIDFNAPSWAEKLSVEKLKSKGLNLYKPSENYWYIEIGGCDDIIVNSENYNKRLLAICLGLWDTIKNSGEFDADYFDIDFIGFIGAKRESRRMVGDYVMTACDIINGGKFDDVVAYGGWPLDDHNPEGFDGDKSNYSIKVGVYGIPYRCLYSKNIKNLFFAGRNISMSHMAMSSARVMGTCSTIGQAVGVATAVAIKENILPREVLKKITDVQDILLENDCYLPYIDRKVRKENLRAVPKNALILCNGKDRNIGDENRYFVSNGKRITYKFFGTQVDKIKIVFDSDFLRESFGDMPLSEKHRNMRCNTLDTSPTMFMPLTLAKSFVLEIKYSFGKIEKIIENKNLKRNILIPINDKIDEMSLTVLSNWGNTDKTGIFSFEII